MLAYAQKWRLTIHREIKTELMDNDLWNDILAYKKQSNWLTNFKAYQGSKKISSFMICLLF